ncbi:hypothetical protein BGZ47_009313 [Haplosporangium gracile]|nr:hypothetical protein BGZ47_009313 [Haplosporangium gracile]
MQWYLKAVDQDLPEAQFKIGVMYERGRGVPKEKTAALEFFKTASTHRDTDAFSQFVVDYMYFHGHGVSQDYSTAFYWFLVSARQDLPEAQLKVGNMYRRGRGVSKNYVEAMSWLLKATKQGLPRAQHDVGIMRRPKGIHQGQLQAQRELGDVFFEGLEVPVDYTVALEWYSKSTLQNDAASERRIREIKEIKEVLHRKQTKDKRFSRLKFWKN